MKKTRLLTLLLVFILLFSSCSILLEEPQNTQTPTQTPMATIAPTFAPTLTPTLAPTMNGGTGNGDSSDETITLSNIPPYSGEAFVAINDYIPFFTADDITANAYEYYSDLDALGRCGVVMACCGKEIMPTGERGDISGVKPSGWVQAKYDFISGKYLYNRCHLIGWQLSAEDANKKNLITGTRYFNVDGMLPFENMVADYIKETGNHVMYRVTPIYEGNNLVASGVLLEGYSVEDEGEGICFNVFCYNVQPGVVIDYTTGVSRLEGGTSATATVKPTIKPTIKPTEKPVVSYGCTEITGFQHVLQLMENFCTHA